MRNYNMLTEIEKRIIAAIQGNIPVCKYPYKKLAEKTGVSEKKFVETLSDLCSRGVIRRFGATIRHQQSGFNANAMVAWNVDKAHINTVGEKLASFKQITHCYRRKPHNGWPYNLYTMIHGKDEKTCRETVHKISKNRFINNYVILFSRRELKKTSMCYFPDF
jgi:DNA-binding Lrp family transcriptional regulator